MTDSSRLQPCYNMSPLYWFPPLLTVCLNAICPIACNSFSTQIFCAYVCLSVSCPISAPVTWRSPDIVQSFVAFVKPVSCPSWSQAEASGTSLTSAFSLGCPPGPEKLEQVYRGAWEPGEAPLPLNTQRLVCSPACGGQLRNFLASSSSFK